MHCPLSPALQCKIPWLNQAERWALRPLPVLLLDTGPSSQPCRPDLFPPFTILFSCHTVPDLSPSKTHLPTNPPCSLSLASRTLHDQADYQGAGPPCHFHGDVIIPPCGTFVSLQVYLGSGVKMAVVLTDAMVGPQWSNYCGKTFRSWVGESISEKGNISVHLGPRLALSARTGLRVSLIALTVSLHQSGESPHPHPAGTTHWSQQGNVCLRARSQKERKRTYIPLPNIRVLCLWKPPSCPSGMAARNFHS